MAIIAGLKIRLTSGREIDLTEDEAREVLDCLHALSTRGREPVYVPLPTPYPMPCWPSIPAVYPLVTWQDHTSAAPLPVQPITTCGN